MERYTAVRQALEQVEEGRSQVARLRRAVEELEVRCTAATGRMGRIPAGGHRAGPPELWDRLCDRREALIRASRAQDRLEASMEGWIDLLPRPRWRMVLRSRYLDGLSLLQTAETLTEATGREFSSDQIYRLHAQALAAAEKLWPLSQRDSPSPAAPTTGTGCLPTEAVTASPKPAAAAGAGSRSEG